MRTVLFKMVNKNDILQKTIMNIFYKQKEDIILKQLFFDFYHQGYFKPVIQFEQEIIRKLKEKMALAILKNFIKKEVKNNDNRWS